MPRPVRTNSASPVRRRSRPSALLTVGWARPRRWAAREIWRSAYTASNTSNRLRSAPEGAPLFFRPIKVFVAIRCKDCLPILQSNPINTRGDLTMLDGFTPWPPELAQRFRAAGHWEGLTLWGMVARTVARLPDKVALVAGERRATYADLDRASARLGAALLRQGIRPLDRVVVQLPNTARNSCYCLPGAGAHRRDSGAGAARAPPQRGAPLHHAPPAPWLTVVPDVAHQLRLPAHGHADAGRRSPACGCSWWAKPAPGRRSHAALLQGLTDDEVDCPKSAPPRRPWTRPTWPPCCCRAAPPRCPS
jgi:hypothetical protein